MTFIDADDNTMLVRLGPERLQLAVVDSRPGIEGSELRAFASAVFQAYVGPPLVEQLAAAASQLVEVEAAGGLSAEQVTQLAAVRRTLSTVEGALIEPELQPATRSRRNTRRRPAWLDPTMGPASPPPAVAPAEPSEPVEPGPQRRKPRTFRTGEGYLLDWGWKRIAA